MTRANRHYIPDCIWHITHRCHKKEFLLKFAHDRHRFVSWLREARKRFGIQILNYTATSNHVHLLVKDTGDAKERAEGTLVRIVSCFGKKVQTLRIYKIMNN